MTRNLKSFAKFLGTKQRLSSQKILQIAAFLFFIIFCGGNSSSFARLVDNKQKLCQKF